VQQTDDPFAAYRKPLATKKSVDDPFAAYQSPAKNATAPDFTSNPSREGVYQMQMEPGTFVSVPYSRVMAASQAGYKIKPDDRERYMNDRAEEVRKTRGGRALTFDEKHALDLPEAMPPVGWRERLDAFLRPGSETTAGGKAAAVAKGTASGLISPVLHPVRTVQSSGQSVMASGLAPGGMYPTTAWTGNRDVDDANARAQEAAQESEAEQGREMAKTPVYSISSIVGPALVLHGAAKILPKAPTPAESFFSDRLRNAVIGKTPVKEMVTKTAAANASEIGTAAAKNAAQDAAHLDQTQDALHETEGRELAHSAAVKEAEAKASHEAAEENAARLEAHAKAVKTVEAENAARTARADAATKKARLDVAKKNRESAQAHASTVAETKRGNEQVVKSARDRARIESDLESSSRALDEKYQKAEQQAKLQNDQNWNAWRKKVAGVTANMEPVVGAIRAQEAHMSTDQVAAFRDILRETKPGPEDQSEAETTRQSLLKSQGYTKPYSQLPAQARAGIDRLMGAVGLDEVVESGLKDVPASRLHGWKAQLESAVRTAKDGTVRYAMGQVLERVRALENEVSEAAGAHTELARARASHGPYVDTFRNSPNEPQTVASKSLTEQTPDYVKEQARHDRLAQVSRFDPSIASLAQHVENLRAALKAVPDVTISENAKPLPPKPTPLPKPEAKAPTLKPIPSPPETVTPKPVQIEPPARVAPPDRPAPIEPNIQKVGPEEIRQAKLGALNEHVKWIERRGRWLASGLAFSTAIRGIVHGSISEVGESALAAAGTLYLTDRVGAALQHPAIAEWLARPTPRDLAELQRLPPEQRAAVCEALTPLVTEATARGLKVSPALVALAAGVSAQPAGKHTKALQDIRSKYAGTAAAVSAR